ncbi:MAG: amidase family protein [Candidatus Promineifilaceae bacterium]|nr:amidase family protein [Candidatus Promineifilaceae bacterium]
MLERPIVYASAAVLAQRIRQGRVTAAETLAAYLGHIERYNPHLNALVMLDTERAQTRARAADEALAHGAYCSVFNLSDHPAVSLPVGQSATGLPIGVQLVGQRWADMALLDVAEQIETVVGPWRRPPLVAG